MLRKTMVAALAALTLGAAPPVSEGASVVTFPATLATARSVTVYLVQDGVWRPEVLFRWAVTAGTTEDVTVYCEEGADEDSLGWIPHCTDSAPSTCTGPGKLVYDVSSETAHTTLVKARAAVVRCWWEDEADGNGTLDAVTFTISDP